MAERILQDIAELEKRLTKAQINKNTAEKAEAYNKIGVAYYFLEDFHRAIEYLNQYLSIAEEVGDRANAGRAYCNLGCAYASLGDFQTALEYHEKGLSIAKEVGDRAVAGSAYGNLGCVYHSLGDSQTALEYHEKSLSIAKEVGDRAVAGNAYGNLGCVYQSLGDSQTALEHHKKSLKIAKEVGDRAHEGCDHGNLGNTYQSLGEFRRAIEYHNQHLSIAKEVGSRACQGKALANLVYAYRSLNEFQEAIEHANKYLIIAKEVGDRAGQGEGYGILGEIYSVLGEYQQAIEYTNKSLIIAEEDGNRAMEGKAYSVLRATYLRLDEFERAMKCHKKQLSIVNEVGDRDGKKGKAHSYSDIYIGDVTKSLGDQQGALEYYKQFLINAEEIGDRDVQGCVYCRLGDCYTHLEDFKEAIKCYQQHLRIAKEIGDWRGQACAYSGLGRCFLFSDSLNEALEQFRCSVKVYDTIRASSISEDKLKISFRTKHQFAYTHLWQVLVMLERNDEALYAAESGRAQALLDVVNVTYGLTSLSPRSIESEEEVRFISRKTTVLTVFLALHLKTVNIWVLGKEGNPIFRQAELEIGHAHQDSFTLLLDTALQKIIRDGDQTLGSSPKTTDFLQPLYEVLIGPIEDLLDGDELIVVPDGALTKAPWAALSETLRIRTVPSLTSLKVITDSPIEYHNKSGALLVGDPCLKKITDKQGNPIYDPLKYARMEVEMIGKILESQPLTGEDATKEAVLQRIGSVALVHIAAHGKKENGEIFLAPDPRCASKPPTEEDYIMKMSDIQAVRLRARLVVLSCCYSGQGEVSSEGVVGMARAFLFAGARSVLATLWAVDDEATMMFMKSFYQQLGSGESASVALQRAMKCLRDSHDYSAPKYWAPFVLMGDDVKIELEKESLSKSDALKV